MRVPMDFNWPIGEVWGGYLNPHYRKCTKCKTCDGTGYAPEAKRFKDQWYGHAEFDPAAYGAVQVTADHPAVVEFARRNVERSPEYYGAGEAVVARECQRLWRLWRGQWAHHLIQEDVDALVEAGRLGDFTRRPRTPEQTEELAKVGGYWMRESNGYTPTPEEVNAWSLVGFGHDSINCWVCVEARCKREGFELNCAKCGGGELWTSPEAEQAAEDWEREEPPTGEGFQLWETTSEGSPKSEVFATIEELCAWCAENATTFADHKATATEWRKMLDADFVCHREGNAVFL